MMNGLIEVRVVGPVLLRNAVVSLLACQPEFHVSDLSHAMVRVEVGASPEASLGFRQSGRFILVRPEHSTGDSLPAGAYIGFDESVTTLRQAIMLVADTSHHQAKAA
jgi:hypothetical protein